jgi:tripartite-type tricarboxylate transporter receptor subunit TctC
MFANISYAKEVIPVYTKFTLTNAGGRLVLDFTRIMTALDDKYEYRYAAIPGAEGESAIARSYADMKDNRKVLLFTANAEFTLNRFNNARGYDKSKDFVYIQGVQSTIFAVMTPKNKGAKSLEELVSRVKNSKEKLFYGVSSSSGIGINLTERFIEQYGLANNLKPLNFATVPDIAQSAISGEYEFVIFDPTSLPEQEFNILMTASRERHPYYLQIPTATELGLKKMFIQTATFLATPNKEDKQFIDHVQTIAKKACQSEEMIDILIKYKRIPKCLSGDILKAYIDEEYETYFK